MQIVVVSEFVSFDPRKENSKCLLKMPLAFLGQNNGSALAPLLQGPNLSGSAWCILELVGYFELAPFFYFILFCFLFFLSPPPPQNPLRSSLDVVLSDAISSSLPISQQN